MLYSSSKICEASPHALARNKMPNASQQGDQQNDKFPTNAREEEWGEGGVVVGGGHAWNTIITL